MGGRLCNQIRWGQGFEDFYNSLLIKYRISNIRVLSNMEYPTLENNWCSLPSTLQAATTVYAVPFTIVKGDTYALCNLDFDTNLRKIDYAEVEYSKLIKILIILQQVKKY